MAQEGQVVMEDVELLFRNFTGKEGPYNPPGARNFAIKLDDDTAAAMAEDGWNVKWLKVREDAEEDETPQAFLDVAVKYSPKARPPRIVQVTSRGRTNLDEDSIEMLDWVDITNVDLIIRPYTWEVQGKTGVKAYLQSIYVTIEEDPLERKYGDMDIQSQEDHGDSD